MLVIPHQLPVNSIDHIHLIKNPNETCGRQHENQSYFGKQHKLCVMLYSTLDLHYLDCKHIKGNKAQRQETANQKLLSVTSLHN